jgi:hypothetical protein
MIDRIYNIKPLPTNYNGIKFRSKLEAQWAVFFNELGYDFEYEPEGFTDGKIKYVPDFFIKELDMFFEIKPTDKISEKELDKLLLASLIKPIGLCCGLPMKTHIRSFNNKNENAEFILTHGFNKIKYGNFFFTTFPFDSEYFKEEILISKKSIKTRFNNLNK